MWFNITIGVFLEKSRKYKDWKIIIAWFMCITLMSAITRIYGAPFTGICLPIRHKQRSTTVWHFLAPYSIVKKILALFRCCEKKRYKIDAIK